MKYFYNEEKIPSIDDAISRYPVGEFKTATRSTVPLLDLIKHQPARLECVFEEIGIQDPAELHLEFTVRPLHGKGTASHTDVMIISGNDVVAIEVKWTESRYDTVDTWLKGGDSEENRQLVLQGWLEDIAAVTGIKLGPDSYAEIVYQMLHRAASVCRIGSKPQLVYLQFVSSPDKQVAEVEVLKNDLARFHALLNNPACFPFTLVSVSIKPTKFFHSLPATKGKEENVELVKTALRGDDALFSFGAFSCVRI